MLTNWVFTHRIAIRSGNSQLEHKHKPGEPAFHRIESLASIVLTVISSGSDISISKLRLYSSPLAPLPHCRPSVFPLCANCLHSLPVAVGFSGALRRRRSVAPGQMFVFHLS